MIDRVQLIKEFEAESSLGGLADMLVPQIQETINL